MERYRMFCYRVLGARLDRVGPDELLEDRLKQGGISATAGMHRSVLIVTLAIASAATAVGAFVFFYLILAVPLWYAYVVLAIGIVVIGGALGFRFSVSARISNRKDQLERELPFTFSELSVLASTGTAPIQLMRRMAHRDHDPGMTQEFGRVVYKTDVQGKDLITALAETAKESPSQAVRESFWDLANMIHQGGNLDEYLRSRSDDILKLKRLVQKDFIERLSVYLDMYVALVLVGVLMIAVGAFLLDSLGQTIAGINANTLLLALTFGLVPLSVIVTMLLISIAYARAE